SVLSVLAGMAELDAADARQAVRQGEGVRFGRHGIGTPDRLLASQAAWRRGMLVVQDESLGAVIEALRPYRRGYLRISAPAAGSGSWARCPWTTPTPPWPRWRRPCPFRSATTAAGWSI